MLSLRASPGVQMQPERIMVSRTDRAGDFILTLPVFRELKKAFPASHLIAHVRSYTAPLARLAGEIDEIILDDAYPAGLWSSPLAEDFRTKRLDLAIIVHPAGRSILAAWRAGIRYRVGRASNLFQLFLNDRRVQKRSRNEKHEFEYNLDLLTGIVPVVDFSPWAFKLPEKLVAEGMAFLAGVGMADCRPVIIHPGHGGSAHNISTAMYAQIVAGLLQNDVPVIISLGPGEEALRQHFPEPVRGRLAFAGGLSDLAALAGVFAGCSAFCGGSTGPLHLAAALRLPCAAFFPPVAAMTPKRWGPVGCTGLIIKPQIADCDGRCASCGSNGCMSRLQIQPAVAWLTGERKQ